MVAVWQVITRIVHLTLEWHWGWGCWPPSKSKVFMWFLTPPKLKLSLGIWFQGIGFRTPADTKINECSSSLYIQCIEQCKLSAFHICRLPKVTKSRTGTYWKKFISSNLLSSRLSCVTITLTTAFITITPQGHGGECPLEPTEPVWWGVVTE